MYRKPQQRNHDRSDVIVSAKTSRFCPSVTFPCTRFLLYSLWPKSTIILRHTTQFALCNSTSMGSKHTGASQSALTHTSITFYSNVYSAVVRCRASVDRMCHFLVLMPQKRIAWYTSFISHTTIMVSLPLLARWSQVLTLHSALVTIQEMKEKLTDEVGKYGDLYILCSWECKDHFKKT